MDYRFENDEFVIDNYNLKPVSDAYLLLYYVLLSMQFYLFYLFCCR